MVNAFFLCRTCRVLGVVTWVLCKYVYNYDTTVGETAGVVWLLAPVRYHPAASVFSGFK
ncbi:hypothetical protein HSB1_21840 [Halogranum salarium B-1]|uniref:Uncharacterized protein n=1 Tax=Halogranum salarium B-1 TaxID=1210908 RepID=J3JGE3_9EURY|nr:hypothetical protein HSB1_21840 [Halogranum salarium B-1]